MLADKVGSNSPQTNTLYDSSKQVLLVNCSQVSYHLLTMVSITSILTDGCSGSSMLSYVTLHVLSSMHCMCLASCFIIWRPEFQCW